MPLTALHEEIAACTKCTNVLARYGAKPAPVFDGSAGQPIFVLGQAPGTKENKSGKAFQGDAGRELRDLFAEFGLIEFDRHVYQTSVTKCFPGRLPGVSSDRVPSMIEIQNCSAFLFRQLKLVKPQLIVCLGALAYNVMFRHIEAKTPGYRASVGLAASGKLLVPQMVGREFRWRGLTLLPLIHTSPLGGIARAQNPTEDLASKQLLLAWVKTLDLTSTDVVSVR